MVSDEAMMEHLNVNQLDLESLLCAGIIAHLIGLSFVRPALLADFDRTCDTV